MKKRDVKVAKELLENEFVKKGYGVELDAGKETEGGM